MLSYILHSASMLIAILSIVILILSVIIHEVSHGYAADWLGDPTPRLQGRLTLNPVPHIDPLGSIIVPIVSILLFHAGFGWAKPVVYNPYNLKNKRRGEFLIALAGPVSNLLLALIFGTIIRFVAMGAETITPFLEICSYIVYINILLAIFNLIPLPPLDGSKLLLAFLPNQYGRARMVLERFSPVFVLIALLLVWQIIYPIVPVIFRLFTGVSF